MIGEDGYTIEDALAHAVARVRFLAVQQRAAPDPATVSSHLDAIAQDLVEHAERFGVDCARYGDGRPVYAMERTGSDRLWATVFHPQPSHSDNRPRVIAEDADLGGGSRGTVMVNALGSIDVVRRNTTGGG